MGDEQYMKDIFHMKLILKLATDSPDIKRLTEYLQTTSPEVMGVILDMAKDTNDAIRIHNNPTHSDKLYIMCNVSCNTADWHGSRAWYWNIRDRLFANTSDEVVIAIGRLTNDVTKVHANPSIEDREYVFKHVTYETSCWHGDTSWWTELNNVKQTRKLD